MTSATSDAMRQRHRKDMNYFLESGVLEFKCEREKRERRLPDDIRKALALKDGPVLERTINQEEAELVRNACSIPPVATLETLCSDDLASLADLFEGWAQDRRLDNVTMVKLLGWADGFRALVSTVGVDHMPLERGVGERDTLLKFIATRMKAG